MTAKPQHTPAWPAASSRSAALFDRACNVLPGGNTRATVYFPPHPLYAAEAGGAYVTDADGVRRLDVVNNYTSMIHGHCHPAIMDSVTKQMKRLGAVGLPTEMEIRLAELLASRVPSFERLRFVNSGTEAVMTALRAARAHTQKPKIAKCEGAYHGSYDFAEISQVSTPANWGADRPASTPTSRGTPQGVLDDVVVIPLNRTELAERILEEHAKELACVLIDPLPMRAGVIPADRTFLRMLRDFTKRHNIVLLYDEVVSFRLGYHGAQGLFGVEPDLTTIGKIIGGGFPIGAVAGKADIMAVFDPRAGRPPLAHGGTFNANPVTMAAGHTAMELLTPDAFKALDNMGNAVRQAFKDSFVRHRLRGQVTGLGSLIKIHFHDRRLVDYRSAWPDTGAELQAYAHVFNHLLDRGVFAAPHGLVCLSTVMEQTDIALLTAAMDAALAAVAKAFPDLQGAA